MQAEDLNIGDSKPDAPIAGTYLRQRRDIAARENIFRNPWIGDVWPFRAADDRMQHHNAVVAEQLGAFAGKSVIGSG